MNNLIAAKIDLRVKGKATVHILMHGNPDEIIVYEDKDIRTGRDGNTNLSALGVNINYEK